VGLAMNDAADDLLKRAGTFAESVTGAPGYDAWFAAHLARVKAAGDDRVKLVAALNEALEDLVPIVRMRVPDLEVQANAALGAYSRFFLGQAELIDSIATKKVFALEFTSNRPTGVPNTLNGRFIVDWPITANTKLVGNIGVTFYDSVPADAPPGTDKYRDAQIALQLDRGLGEASIIGPATFSFALYYQYQREPALLQVDPSNPTAGVIFIGLPDAAKTVFAKKGDIRLAQAKLSFAPDGSNVKIPVSVTYSNRTELIDKPAWRAQVGVSYDFDSLFALANRARP